jgi:hypothetical protein
MEVGGGVLIKIPAAKRTIENNVKKLGLQEPGSWRAK